MLQSIDCPLEPMEMTDSPVTFDMKISEKFEMFSTPDGQLDSIAPRARLIPTARRRRKASRILPKFSCATVPQWNDSRLVSERSLARIPLAAE